MPKPNNNSKKAKRARYKAGERNVKRAIRHLVKKNGITEEQAQSVVRKGTLCPKKERIVRRKKNGTK